MSWNGSNQSKTAANGPGGNGPGGRSPAAKSDNLGLTYFITFAVVVAVAAGAAYFVLRGNRGGQSPGEQPEPSGGKIAEVVPATSVSAASAIIDEVAVDATTNSRPLTREEILKKPHWTLSEEERGVVDPSYPERHKQFLDEQSKIPWRTHVDRELALLLFPKDGNTGLLIPFDRKFPARFLESIKTPTLVTKDDSEELKEKKRELNEVKAYLKERMDAGEDIVKLLNDEYSRLKRLYGMREFLKREVRDYVKTAKSWDEVDDFIKAANVMLEKAGGREIKLPIDIKIKREAQTMEESK